MSYHPETFRETDRPTHGENYCCMPLTYWGGGVAKFHPPLKKIIAP